MVIITQPPYLLLVVNFHLLFTVFISIQTLLLVYKQCQMAAGRMRHYMRRVPRRIPSGVIPVLFGDSRSLTPPFLGTLCFPHFSPHLFLGRRLDA
jgi:hypothetical protein